MRSTSQAPIGVRLDDALPDAQVFGERQVYATGCTADARRVRQGDIYFAVSDAERNGADDAALAAERGASAIVTDSYLPLFTTPQFVVQDAATAHSQFCQRLVGEPSHDLRLAAVAGAHGKTTVSRLLTAILRHAGHTTGCLADGLKSDGAATTPSAEGACASAGYTARWMSQCVAQGATHAVTEAGTDAQASGALAGAKLSVLCLTSQRYEHRLGRTPDMQHRLARTFAGRLGPFATLVADADDPQAMRIAAERQGLLLTYSFDKPADLRGTIVSRSAYDQVLMITHEHHTVAVDLPWVGDAMARNALAAVAAAVALGVSLHDACLGIQGRVSVPGVLESLSFGNAFAVRLDQGGTAERLRAALNATRHGATGRTIAVLPEGATAATRSVANSLADLVIVPDQQPDPADPQSATHTVEDRFSAVALAVALAEEGDAVLIAGTPRDADARAEEQAVVRGLIELRAANCKESVSTP